MSDELQFVVAVGLTHLHTLKPTTPVHDKLKFVGHAGEPPCAPSEEGVLPGMSDELQFVVAVGLTHLHILKLTTAGPRQTKVRRTCRQDALRSQ